MAGSLIDNFLSKVEGEIDYEGQKLVENISQIGMLIVAVAAYAGGYMTSSIRNTVMIFGAGCVLVLLIGLPPWPFYNAHPIKWLPVRTESSADGVSVEGKKDQ